MADRGETVQVALLLVLACCGVWQVGSWVLSCLRRTFGQTPESLDGSGADLRMNSGEDLRAPSSVEVNGREVQVEHLIQMKDLRTAYALLFGAGFVGGHHFYLDRLLHGTIAAPHFELFRCGLDGGSTLPTVLHQLLQPNGHCITRSKLWQALLLLALGPMRRHTRGLWHRLGRTAGNPYVILDIDRDASAEELQKAYEAQLRDVEASKDCKLKESKESRESKACRMKKKHLKKAIEFSLRRSGETKEEPPRKQRRRTKSDEDREFDQWFDQRRSEWEALVAEVKEGSTRLFKSDDKAHEDL
ncbi:TM2 domain-containing protein [Durusdinium trenchii]|uniref:TM2 domain-containing protein n=1 Tax=Durusdinium trenchii TaxID=1381693 RepID=A0ABP0KY05_9DINO